MIHSKLLITVASGRNEQRISSEQLSFPACVFFKHLISFLGKKHIVVEIARVGALRVQVARESGHERASGRLFMLSSLSLVFTF
jgi:hypothetical protein